MSYNATQPRDPQGTATGGQWTATGAAPTGNEGTAYQSEPTTKPTPPTQAHHVDVEHDADGDGITDAARVGVPADEVPPPPKVPRLPNLTPEERAVESAFADAYEKDPDGMARKYLAMIEASNSPNKFEADAAKNLFEPWAGKDLPPEQRADLRSTMNTPLHQTANAIAKRAFMMKMDEMSDADKVKGILVTVGGCGAGKGFALKTLGDKIPELNSTRYGGVWDSAGDQNATENPWILKEAAARGVKVTYVYVSADPKVAWADKKRGVVQRAQNPDDGRMVDAAVFADSYVIGAQNHDAFSRKYAGAANFIFLENGAQVRRVHQVPSADLDRNRTELRAFATETVASADVHPRIKRGALAGSRIWGKR